jgi:hypothetical protein
LLLAATAAVAETPAINYISAENVYLNAGRHAGLVAGARVEVVRGGKTVAILEVIHVSSNSASCRIVEQSSPPRVGDAVSFTPVDETPPTEPERLATRTTVSATPGPAPTKNIVSGYVSLGTVWQADLTDSGVSSLQPVLSTRIRVKNAGGTGADFRVRYRARYYFRENAPGESIEADEWASRLTELALVYDDRLADFRWGVGRLIVPDMRGVGFVDGGYLSYRISRLFRAGFAGGFQPDPADMSPDADRLQAGGYLALDYASQRNWRLVSSAALAGNYVSGTVSREFVYWQNKVDLFRRFFLFQSVEVDLNRDWRKDTTGESVTFTNFYLVANAEVWRHTSVDFTYDTRKNPRTYETRNTPDDLFDDGVYDGFGGGVSVRHPRGINGGLRAGVRYREDNRTNLYYSLRLSAVRLPWRGHAASFRYAWAETRSTTAYRPVLSYRFPVGRRLRLTAVAGGYIYERASVTSDSWYTGAGAGYSNGRWYCNGNLRRYFGGNLDSIVMFAELGLNI